MASGDDYARSPKALADLKALNARFIHNFITNDVASHDAILHEEFIAVQSNGARMARDLYLEGLTNLDAICATPVLDAVYIGPADLSFALGMPPRGDLLAPQARGKRSNQVAAIC